jgi:hypothetical protein
LQRIDRPLDVGAEIRDRIRERPDDRDLSGDMADRVQLQFKGGFQFLQIGDVAPNVDRAGGNILTL